MKKKRFVSLNIKVLLLSFVTAIIPISVIGTLLYKKSVEIVTQKQELAAMNALDNISDNLNLVMDYAHNLSLFLIQNDDVQDALKSVDLTEAEKMEKQNNMMRCMTFYAGQKSYMESIYIQGENGIHYHVGEVQANQEKEELLKKIEDRKGAVVWTSNAGEGETGVTLILARDIKNMSDLGENLGRMWIYISNQALEEQFNAYLQTYPGYISMMDQEGMVLLESGIKELQEESSGENLRNLNGGKNWIRNVEYQGDKISYYYRIPETEWILVSHMQLSELLSENHMIMKLLMLGIGVSMGLCLLISILFSRIILKPLRLLTRNIMEIKEDNYKVHLDLNSNDEIGILIHEFNGMSRRLDELVNEVLKEKVLQKEAELKALQAQIDPHFLYNNLDTAYWMSRLEKADKTGKILLALSDLYRLSVSSVNRMISVDTEIRYIQNYIVIQQLRIDDQIVFHLDAKEDTKGDMTMRFVLQPLVENSIQHGILPSGDRGTIWIRIYKRNHILYFEVEDDGTGVDVEELKELMEEAGNDEKRGMAIRNIHQRIQLRFGSDYGLQFYKRKERGTIAVVTQPVQLYRKEDENFETEYPPGVE